MTPDEVRVFQAEHFNHLGKRLRVDGVLGPQTRWALDLETVCEARRHIVLAGQQHIGLLEAPPFSNDDPRGIIRGWCTRAHCKPGDPWCAAAASWCLSHGISPVYEGGAQRLGKRYPATLEPMPGDLFWYPVGVPVGGHQPAHVGIVGGADVYEIMGYEGNCGNAYRCTRRRRAGLNFSRTVPDVTGTCPGVVPSVERPPGATR